MTAAAGKSSRFAARGTTQEIEEGLSLPPKFDQDGVIRFVLPHAGAGAGPIVARINERGPARTIETGEAWCYSRSRGMLWRKGESSGHTLRVRELRVDCDQDALWIKAQPEGPGACHTGRRSCFYRAVRLESPLGATTRLEFRD